MAGFTLRACPAWQRNTRGAYSAAGRGRKRAACMPLARMTLRACRKPRKLAGFALRACKRERTERIFRHRNARSADLARRCGEKCIPCMVGNAPWCSPGEFRSTGVLYWGYRNQRWTLLANSLDHTLARNYIAYKLAEVVGAENAPLCEIVNLYYDSAISRRLIS